MGNGVYVRAMKIRNIVILYTTILLGLFLLFLFDMQGKSFKIVDTVSLNGQFKKVEEALDKNQSVKQVEEKYKCKVLFISDENYEASLMKSLEEGDIILDYYRNDTFEGKVIFAGEGESYRRLHSDLKLNVFGYMLCFLLVGYGVIIIVYWHYIRPFHKLQNFAAEITRGNLDISLEMNRGNYFGAFTESFDIMREELKRAKENEYLANVSKKELMASLSHDMKTPISTIKATCEVIMIKEKNHDTLEKIEVIAGKAEMIDKLIGNMFHATMEELEVLKVEPREEFAERIEEMFLELKYYGNIQLENDIPKCLVYMDSLRLNQVIDNIVNNAFKYAGTDIKVSFLEQENGINITIRDGGNGVPEEELPLVSEKFYRGSNIAGKSGSGLGLYLAKSFMEQMNGGFECFNDNGFVVILFVRKI